MEGRGVAYPIGIEQLAEARELLVRAALILSRRVRAQCDPRRRDEFETGCAAVLDALSWLVDDADAGAVLTALDGHIFTHRDCEACKCVERTRRICREIMQTRQHFSIQAAG
jgi:hypothetical protein